MFLRRRNRGSAPRVASTSDPITGPTRETPQRQAEQLQEWRRSAHRVTRAWNSWLAAERGERDARYIAYVSALADEERAAAEVNRRTQLTDSHECSAHARN